MKLYVETTGGPSPCVIVTAERADLSALADALKNDPLPAYGFPAHGFDALAFRVVSDITPLLKKEKKKTKWFLLASFLGWAAVAGILYLAYLGVKSL